MKTLYIVTDNDGDIVTDDPNLMDPNKPFHNTLSHAIEDGESVASRRDKRDRIFVFKLCKIIKGTE